jgi:uncharacterized membrane protein YdbT with pleckstrin-like domain
MSYINESLSKGETIEQLFKHHWTAYKDVAIWAILAIPTFGITLIVAIYRYCVLKAIEQGVTSKRVIHKKGIVSRKTEEMKLASIETVEITQSILGRIFGYGNVEITGTGINDLIFKSIDDPMSVKKSIEGVEAA